MSKEKQIEEMAKIIDDNHGFIVSSVETAESLYNAGYRKQSENTIELPCKVGDMVYMPWQWRGVKGVAYLTVTHIIFDSRKSFIRTDFQTDDEDYWSTYCCGEFDFADVGKIIFLTKEEAEAKMKGGAE